MSIFTIIFIAIILAMDCFAVSIASGLSMKKFKRWEPIKMAILFGVFQGGMAFIGWAAGKTIEPLIASIDHWIAFLLLLGVGGKMIYGSLDSKCETKNRKTIGLLELITLSIATSIDALAVGLSFAFLDTTILFPSLVIGLASFILTIIGFYLGHKIGCLFRRRAEFAGGLVLIGIGIKILIEHLL